MLATTVALTQLKLLPPSGDCSDTAASDAVAASDALVRPAAAAAAAATLQVRVMLAAVYGCTSLGLTRLTAGVKVRSRVTGMVAVPTVVLLAVAKTRSCRFSWKVAAVLVATNLGTLTTAWVTEEATSMGLAGPGAAPETETDMPSLTSPVTANPDPLTASSMPP